MKKIIFLFMAMIMLYSNAVYAESDEVSKIQLKENGYVITTETDWFDETYQIAWFPLRSALEAIDAKVEWNGLERKIYIAIHGYNYVAVLDFANIEGSFDIWKEKYEDYKPMDLAFNLNQAGGGGVYQIINDRTYIDDCSLIRLLYYLGYYINVDETSKTFEIVPVNEVADKKYKELYKEVLSDYLPVDNEIAGLVDLWNDWHYNKPLHELNILKYSSERFENDDLEIILEFTYMYKDKEKELTDPQKWQIIDDIGLCLRFGGKDIYKMVDKSNADNVSYIIKCDEYYVGYCIIPSEDLK